MPDKEADIRGKDISGISNGADPLNGWFGKQSDGRFRMLRGFDEDMVAVIAEVNGLETIQRLRGPDITVDAAAFVEADQRRIAAEAARSGQKSYIVKRLENPPAIDGKPDEWAALHSMRIGQKTWPEDARAKLAYDDDNLYVLFDVADSSPWKNGGADFAEMFKTGDAVDVQLRAMSEKGAEIECRAGDCRILLCPMQGKPVAVLMKPVDPTAPANAKHEYKSENETKVFDRVELLDSAKVAVSIDGDHYVVEAALPLAAIGLKPMPGLTVRGDVGLISSDRAGTKNIRRVCWANRDTKVIDDPPTEAWLYPAKWGTFTLE